MEDTKILPSTPWAGSRKGKQVQQTWGIFEDVFCPSEFSFQFLENVLTEVIALFPSKYIHIGGDECPKEAWKRSAFCQKLIKDKKLKDEHGLQSYFIQRIEKYINSKGKKIIGWDEILEGGLAPNATVMSWRGEDGGIQAAQQNHEVIMTPGTYCYLDHSQSKNEDSITIGGYLPLEKVYGYEPIPALLKEDQAKHIWGAQGNVWAEYIKNSNKVEYMIFPRMMALSEVLWSPKKNRNWKDFERRLPGIYQRLDAAKINYSKAYYDLKATVLPTDNADGLLWKVESTTNNAIRIQLNQQDSIFTYQNPVFINDLVFLSSASNEKTTITQKFSFNKATGKKITLINEPNKSYPGDGAFTLVNGIQNEKGLAKGTEFLGFLGKDLEATIDLKTTSNIHKVTLHTLDQNGSWIYLPQQVEITYIPDIDYTEDQLKNFPKEIKTIDPIHDKGLSTITIESKQSCRYIKLLAKNVGTITEGNPGAGNPAWLFADEIEIE
jgi:hexosaminidase